MATVLIASDQQTLGSRWLDGLATSGIAVEALSHAEVLDRLSRQPVELCVYDLGEQQPADLAPLKALLEHSGQTLFVAMTPVPEVEQGIELLREGIRGYCNRLIAKELMPIIVRTVQAGELWVGRQVAQHLLARPPQAESEYLADVLATLTPRELHIARLVGEGLSNKAIADEGGITERTVKAHLNAIFRKTGIRNRVQLALAATQQGAADPRAAQA